jgi:hypothetical protein
VIIPISVLFITFSAVGLSIGVLRRNISTLLALSLFWWLCAFGSAYFVYLAWIDRGYSENWAMIGFVYLALPYAAFTVVLILIVLYFTRRWSGKQAKLLQLNLLVLLTFLVLQMIAGFMSA